MSRSAFTPDFYTAKLAPSGQQCDAWADQPLLHSLEAGSIHWPSSCRNGSCRSCLAQVEVGSVRYRIDWPGLTPEEKEWGCILPCVAVATSDLVMRRP